MVRSRYQNSDPFHMLTLPSSDLSGYRGGQSGLVTGPQPGGSRVSGVQSLRCSITPQRMMVTCFPSHSSHKAG